MAKKGGLFGKLLKKASSKLSSQEEDEEEDFDEETGASASLEEEEEDLPPPPDTMLESDGSGGLYRLWETGYAKSNSTPDLVFACGADPIPLDEMRQKLEMKRVKTWVDSVGSTHMKPINDALKKYKEDEKLEAEMAAEEGRSPRKTAYPDVDGKAELTVSTDGMVGWLILLPPMGEGAHVDYGDVKLLIDEQKIVHGVNEDYIKSMIKHRRYFHLFPVVQGTAPVLGKDGRVIEFYAKERICIFTPDVDGNLDYRAQNYFQPVFKDGTICEIRLPTDGVEGRNARGEMVPSKPGTAAQITVGPGTHVTEAGTELVADEDGDVVYENGAFTVRITMQVSGDVDYSTGNINFMGDVHIKGNVRDKFIVRATGSVIVDGVLESAIIDADGDVIIAGGILGDGEGTIRSRGNVRAKFMESCIVYAAQSVQTDYILGSQVYCDGPLMVTSGKGIIMGGTISVHSYIESKSIGSPHTGRMTTLNMGMPPCHGAENFVDAQGIDPAAMLQEVADSEEDAAVLLNCRAKFSNIHVGAVINFGRDTLNIEREWNGVSIRYDEKDQRILLT